MTLFVRMLFKRGNMAIGVAFFLMGFFLVTAHVWASSTSQFQQTINAGTLAVDIVDASFSTVASPSVTFGATTFSFSCGTSTGTFGTNTERIYVQNPDAADDGWTVTLAANSVTTTWTTQGSVVMDFNDTNAGGCTDGGGPDVDSAAGLLFIESTSGSIQTGSCLSCSSGSVSLGSRASFSEGLVTSITMITGAAGSDDIGDWVVTGTLAEQVIPPEQAATSTYSIDMTLSIQAT